MRDSEIEKFVTKSLLGVLTEEENFMLLENKKPNTIGNSLVVFYTHMIKYYYQPLKRTESWISSILNSRENIYNMYINNNYSGTQGFKAACAKFTEDDFRRWYNKGKEIASRETGINIDNLDEYPFHNYEYDFFNFDNICNAEHLYYFLINLCLNNKDRDYVITQFKKKKININY